MRSVPFEDRSEQRPPPLLPSSSLAAGFGRGLGTGLLVLFLAACGLETDDGQEVGPAEEAGQAHEHDHGAANGVAEFGEVDFPVSCRDEVADAFEEAVALLHSFYFTRAREAFQAVAEEDPDCAMAHWGLAMTYRANPFAGPPPSGGDEAGLVAARKAQELGPPTEREAGYVEAVLALFEDHENVDYRSRMLRYEEAMDRLRSDHPEDQEAAIFFAREVTANASPADQTFERQLRAVEVMEPLFEENPRHPGLAHYIIHAYDAPQLAERGLEAAHAYAEIAPDAPHALHMPSHIYTRMGYWDESIEMNRRSAEVDDPDAPHRLHAWDYKVYAFLQQGRDGAAEELVERAREVHDRIAPIEGSVAYNAVAMPARLVLERDRWEQAAALPVEGAENTPAEAVSRFARGLGAVRSGDVDMAGEETEALARIRDALREAGEEDWADRTEAQRLAVSAWISFHEGAVEEAVALADEGATLEERVEKHPVTPGPLIPARELHAELLLEAERPGEALEAFQATLQREPNRSRTLAGAARAAEAAGDREAAIRYHGELVDVMANADVEHPALERARSALESR